MNKKMLLVLAIVFTVLIGIAFHLYGIWLVDRTTQRVIESAALVEIDDTGYVLDFDGDAHLYSFD